MAPEHLEEFIKVKLIRNEIGEEMGEVNFRVSTVTRMDKIKHLYASCQGLAAESLRFFFNGRRINGDICPWNLDMKDGDVVEVFIEKKSRELTIDDNLFIKLVGFSGEKRVFKIRQSNIIHRPRQNLILCSDITKI